MSVRTTCPGLNTMHVTSLLDEVICPRGLLPLFHDSAHTVALVKHTMDVVRKAVQHGNAGQTPVVTFTLPLYAIAKLTQSKGPEMYGQDKLEMAALGTLGDCLQGSGWVEALVQAEITTAGTADAFLRTAHVARTRHAHVTAVALYSLQYRTYNNRDTDTEDEPLLFDEWCSKLPSIAVLGNSHVTGVVFTGLCAVPAAVLLQQVPRCSDRTCSLVLCSGPH